MLGTTDWLFRSVFKFILTTILGKYVVVDDTAETDSSDKTDDDANSGGWISRLGLTRYLPSDNGNSKDGNDKDGNDNDGEVVLNGLRLECDAINEALDSFSNSYATASSATEDLETSSFRFKSGTIGSLHIIIPWTQLMVDPCTLRLNDVHLVIKPNFRVSRESSCTGHGANMRCMGKTVDASLSESMMLMLKEDLIRMPFEKRRTHTENVKKHTVDYEKNKPSSNSATLTSSSWIPEDTMKFAMSYLESLLATTEISIRRITIEVNFQDEQQEPHESHTAPAEDVYAIILKIESLEMWREQTYDEGPDYEDTKDYMEKDTMTKYLAGRKLSFRGLNVELQPSRSKQQGANEQEEGMETQDDEKICGGHEKMPSESAKNCENYSLMTSSLHCGFTETDNNDGIDGSLECLFNIKLRQIHFDCHVEDAVLILCPQRVALICNLLETISDQNGLKEASYSEHQDDEHLENSINHSMYRSTHMQQSLYQSTNDFGSTSVTPIAGKSGEVFTAKSKLERNLEKEVVMNKNHCQSTLTASVNSTSSVAAYQTVSNIDSLGEFSRILEDKHMPRSFGAKIHVFKIAILGDSDCTSYFGHAREAMYTRLYLLIEVTKLAVHARPTQNYGSKLTIKTQGIVVRMINSNTDAMRSFLWEELPSVPWPHDVDKERNLDGVVLEFLKPNSYDDTSMLLTMSSKVDQQDGSHAMLTELKLWPVLIVMSSSFLDFVEKTLNNISEAIAILVGSALSMSSESDVPAKAEIMVTADFAGVRLLATCDNECSGTFKGEIMLIDISLLNFGSVNEYFECTKGCASMRLKCVNRFGEAIDITADIALSTVTAYVVLVGDEMCGVDQIFQVLTMKANVEHKTHENETEDIENSTLTEESNFVSSVAISWKTNQTNSSLSRSDAIQAVKSSSIQDYDVVFGVHRRFMEMSETTIDMDVELLQFRISEGIVRIMMEIIDGLIKSSKFLLVVANSRSSEAQNKHITSLTVEIPLDVIEVILFDGKDIDQLPSLRNSSGPGENSMQHVSLKLLESSVFFGCMGGKDSSTYLSVVMLGYELTETSGKEESKVLLCNKSQHGDVCPAVILDYLSPTVSRSEPALFKFSCEGVLLFSRVRFLPLWLLELPAQVARLAPPIQTQQNDMDVIIGMNNLSWIYSTEVPMSIDRTFLYEKNTTRACMTVDIIDICHYSRGREEHVEATISKVCLRFQNPAGLGSLKRDDDIVSLIRSSRALGSLTRENNSLLGKAGFAIAAWEDSLKFNFDGKVVHKQGKAELSNDRLNIIVSPSMLKSATTIVTACQSSTEDNVQYPWGRKDHQSKKIVKTGQSVYNVLDEVEDNAFIASEKSDVSSRLFDDDDDGFELVYMYAPHDKNHDANWTENSRNTGQNLQASVPHTGDDFMMSSHLFGDSIQIRDDYIDEVSADEITRSTSASSDVIGPLPSSYPPSLLRLDILNINVVATLQDGALPAQESLEINLQKSNVQLDIFSDSCPHAWRCGMIIKDFDVLDYSKGASWRKVIGYYQRQEQPRETMSSMIEVVIDGVRPNPKAKELVEIRVKFSALPLRLRLDQRIIQFLTELIGSSMFDSAQGSERDRGNEKAILPPPIFIQSCLISPWLLFVDYIPRRMDVSSLRNGNLAELLNIVSWGGVKLTLRRQTITGIEGLSNMFETVVKFWLDEIVSTQVHKFAKGMVAVRSVCSIAEGVQSLITSPIRELRKEDGKIGRGLTKGIAALARSLGKEILKLGCHVTCSASSILRKVEYKQWRENVIAKGKAVVFHIDEFDNTITEGNSDSNPKQSDMPVPKQSDLRQPTNVAEGMRQASYSLSNGLKDARAAVIESSGVPLAVVTIPSCAAIEAVHRMLLGARNSLDPSRVWDAEDRDQAGRQPTVLFLKE